MQSIAVWNEYMTNFRVEDRLIELYNPQENPADRGATEKKGKTGEAYD